MEQYDKNRISYAAFQVTEDMQLVIKLKGSTTVTEAIFLNTERSPV